MYSVEIPRKFHGIRCGDSAQIASGNSTEIPTPHNNSNSNKYILYSLLLRVDKRNIYFLLLSSALLLDFR